MEDVPARRAPEPATPTGKTLDASLRDASFSRYPVLGTHSWRLPDTLIHRVSCRGIRRASRRAPSAGCAFRADPHPPGKPAAAAGPGDGGDGLACDLAHAFSWLWLLPPLAVFFAIAVYHSRVLEAKVHAERAVAVYHHGLARIADRWA